MDILVGVIVLLFGIGIATMGLRVWFWMLPILGFLAGFTLGTILVYQIAGDGILATLLSWVVGFIGGVAFALISWLWWYAGVIIAAGAAGAMVATAIAASFGVDAQWALLIWAVIGAALFAFAALALNLPIYLVIVNTALAGGIAVVAGLLLIFNRIDLDQLGEGYATAVINHSLWWWLLWISVVAVGIVVQLQQQAVVAFPEERYIAGSRAARR
jgi:hypothetical protein